VDRWTFEEAMAELRKLLARTNPATEAAKILREVLIAIDPDLEVKRAA